VKGQVFVDGVEVQPCRKMPNNTSGFSGCGKMYLGLQEVSGHGFSRAVNATKQIWALAPAGFF
jgi:hypothetical protein